VPRASPFASRVLGLNALPPNPNAYAVFTTRHAPLADASGLGEIDRSAARVRVDDKRMINARADVNQVSTR
jgi:hypothetical protein